MSHRIEYQWTAFRIPGTPLGLAGDHYIVAIECGDGAVRDPATRRRSRQWEACMAGTAVQVLRQAARHAAACESGGVRMEGSRCTPESYIRRIRGLLHRAATIHAQGNWRARLQAAPGHPAVETLRRLGLQSRLETQGGATYAVVEPTVDHLGAFLDLLDRYADDIPAPHWFDLRGLPTF